MDKSIKSTDLIQILRDCISYLSDCSEIDKEQYLKEFAKTGLFHDAIGNVIEIKDDIILIEEEY